MWLASTFDLPWTGPTPNGAQLPTTAEPADTLDIELLSELINGQDSSNVADPAQVKSNDWSESNGSSLWTPTPGGVEPVTTLNNAGFLDASEDWLNSPDSQQSLSEQGSSFFDSLTDLSALGSLTIKSEPSPSPCSHLEELAAPAVKVESSSLDSTSLKRSSRDDSTSPTTGSEDDSEPAPQKKKRKTPRRQPPKDSMAYKRRREQNNQAVRRCRQKTKERNDENQKAADDLREENSMLRERLNVLFREVRSLRAMMGMGSSTTDHVSSLGSSTLPQSGPTTASTCQSNPTIWQGLASTLVI